MDTRLSWDEIRTRYPDQWVSIIEPESSNTGRIYSGIVIAHGSEKKSVAVQFKEQKKKGLRYKIHSFRYTGKIPSLVGINTIVMDDVRTHQ